MLHSTKIKITKGSGRGMDVLPSLPKGSGMIRLLVSVPVPRPRVFQQGRTRHQGISSGCTELTKVSGTGLDVVPNLPRVSGTVTEVVASLSKCQVR